MNGIASVTIVGNLTRDPESRYLPSGTAVVSFGVAVNRSFTQNGEKKQTVTFIDVTAFGKQGETVAQYMKKGKAILVQGRLEASEWTDKQTQQKRSKLGVVLESFTFLDSGPREGGESAPRAAKPAPKESAPEGAEDGSDDVPF